MIVSASRRTDIPAFFSDWFLRRIEEKYAYVRNPMNPHQVGKINLSPDIVDCIVFWSKNPQPVLDKLGNLENYMYYFQFTLNAYDKDLEQNLPSLENRIKTFQELSKIVGMQRVLWRYDPIVLNDKYTIDWHTEKYAYIAERLSSFTEKCTISFIDMYPKISRQMRRENICELSVEDKITLAKRFSSIAHSCGLTIDTCAEDIDLSDCHIGHARCIDDRLISRLLGCSITVEKDPNQRSACGCVSSVDLGLYNTCQNGCAYCYANHNPNTRVQNFQAYDPNSPLLCSRLTDQDKITERRVKSYKDLQLHLFSL